MRTATFRFTARLSALTVSAGALAVLLASPDARSVDREMNSQGDAYLEGLMIRHDVRYALEVPRNTNACPTDSQERG
ncbi:hypothetical protein [Povalibacter sp.]|uniref:hypothetical protein n=1 Tax=Povalibacter sp. TaxID=1962978 RepID=UPI002F40E751